MEKRPLRLLLCLKFSSLFRLKNPEYVAYDNENYQSGNDAPHNANRNGEGRNYDQNSDRAQDPIFSKRVKAGKRRTYFFDVRATRGNDYFLTITESKKRFDDGGYDRHKMFLYKEDFNKFAAALQESIDYVKTDLMPDFDFDSFSHEEDAAYFAQQQQHNYTPAESETTIPVESIYLPVAEDFTVAETAPDYVEMSAVEEAASVASHKDVEIDGWKA